MAPEVIMQEYGAVADEWSVGAPHCLLFQTTDTPYIFANMHHQGPFSAQNRVFELVAISPDLPMTFLLVQA